MNRSGRNVLDEDGTEVSLPKQPPRFNLVVPIRVLGIFVYTNDTGELINQGNNIT